MYQDFQHLKLLSIFHYIVGVGMILIGSLPILHVVIGLMMIFAPASLGAGPPPPPMMGWLFAVLGGVGVLFGWSLGIGMMLAGRFLRRRTHYIYCLVMAGLSLMFQPFGTVLGVFTFVVLLRPSVKQLFETGELPYDPEEDDIRESIRDDRIAAGSYNIHSER